MADGKDWYETRRFTFKHFRGLEKVVSEDLIKEEIDVLIDSVEHESIIPVSYTHLDVYKRKTFTT